jgi:hypothetical protein
MHELTIELQAVDVTGLLLVHPQPFTRQPSATTLQPSLADLDACHCLRKRVALDTPCEAVVASPFYLPTAIVPPSPHETQKDFQSPILVNQLVEEY